MCNVYGLSYLVAGTTTATSVEANGVFFSKYESSPYVYLLFLSGL